MANPNPTTHFHFSTVTGIFLQDEKSTDPDTSDFVSSNFGLINRAYLSDSDDTKERTQWQRLKLYLDELNVSSPSDTQYKLLFLGRHGQGVHNVAESRYGTVMWDCRYSLLNGDEHGDWFDARLTDIGIDQARTVNKAWKTQIQNGIPPPESFYVSPLIRCCETAQHSFENSGLPGTEPFRPVVKELLRETLGLHTCDARSPKSTIQAFFPSYVFEPGFSEEDKLHKPSLRESDSARDARFYEFLSDIFGNDGNTVLSLTAHSGAIMSILSVVGHRPFVVNTGGVIPVLVKAERREGKEKERVVEPWFEKPAYPN
ncbi:histidine phosphatase superfamily [Aspergillus crustosus]